ncbi:hypothetical protein GCM10007964_05660 [Sphaerisporangium melleum]|uniref:Uncharacterized protein n=2 Tax=Sphaerisporangium melleum TaxID=321316 RepID=A0A917VDJ5_9ACTN|nr:hypothetical protein GCM10007964_05660 [Sphaerisporangium melleum]
MAASCSSPIVVSSSPVASVDFAWDVCSDGKIHVWAGTLYDRSCDDRTAYTRFFLQRKLKGGSSWSFMNGSSQYKVNGCGNWSTLPEIVLDRNTSSPSSYDFRLVNELWACSSLSCSTYYHSYYSYSY